MGNFNLDSQESTASSKQLSTEPNSGRKLELLVDDYYYDMTIHRKHTLPYVAFLFHN